ncbi:MAG: flavodoxin domain-containing protein [Clostridiales bacterium]|nr:flavodoxin domain-containing protein [Clostridiales bacterium]MDU6975969.1 flavodoxin domain-containing protein [Clostridiales bacterium]
MKAVVVYKSHYGATKEYATWLAKSLHADLLERSKVKGDTLLKYDTIIYGGGLYAGGISGASLITKNFDKLRNKNIIVFTVGLADPKNPDNVTHILKAADQIFPPEVKEHLTFFHLRGGMDYSKLNFVHRAMMAMLKHVLSKKSDKELTDEDKGLLAAYGKQVSFLDQNSITPIVDFASHLSA